MSQRNPMNERYQREDRTGVTRKSAASAKPSRKAAATVTMATSKKTPREKKAEQKAARKAEQQRQRELDAKYYKPDTVRYKKLRRLWMVSLGGAMVCVCASWLLRSVQPEWIAAVFLFGAYALIIYAFYVDFSKIRKERRAYQERMVALEAEAEKEARKAKRGGKADNKADDAGAAAKEDAADAKQADGKQTDGKQAKCSLFRRKKLQSDVTADNVAAEAESSSESSSDASGETAIEKA